jgi:hypothetical protein
VYIVLGIVDRFEGNIVVIEIDGVTKDIFRDDVQANVKKGDIVGLVEGKWVTIEEETKKRTEEIKKIMDEVWED